MPLWSTYCELTRTRQSGMGTNPITFAEIEAYSRLMVVPITPWEVMTLVLADGAVLAKAAKPAGPEPRSEVDARDGAGVSALMKGLGARKA